MFVVVVFVVIVIVDHCCTLVMAMLIVLITDLWNAPFYCCLLVMLIRVRDSVDVGVSRGIRCQPEARWDLGRVGAIGPLLN